MFNRQNYDPKNHTETINDKDGYISNVWRSLQKAPDEVAKYCDWPVNHCDLSARKKELIKNEEMLLENLISNPVWYDAKMAGYWIWAASCWIGSGLTSIGSIPHVANAGMGVHKIGKIPHLTATGMGVQEPYNTNLYVWFRELSERLRYVRVVCGDWQRVCGGDWQDRMGDVGIFFDPPYSDTNRDVNVYHKDDIEVAKDVTDWCLERGKKQSYRIVLAGYEGEHEKLLSHDWTIYKWKAGGGYGNQGGKDSRGVKNSYRERLFLSPHCIKTSLF